MPDNKDVFFSVRELSFMIYSLEIGKSSPVVYVCLCWGNADLESFVLLVYNLIYVATKEEKKMRINVWPIWKQKEKKKKLHLILIC